MSRMSEQHDDLATIHAILLGQRKVCMENNKSLRASHQWIAADIMEKRAETIDDLLLEIEAAGVVWPDNVVEGNFSKCWPKEL